MGRRRHRKLERRGRSHGPSPALLPTIQELTLLDDDELEMLVMNHLRTATAVKACGSCREFLEDQEGGRGTCLHPGSGVLSPWTDTPGCDFFTPRRH